MTIVSSPTEMTFAQACGMALRDAMRADERVFLIGEDIGDDECGGAFQVTKGLSLEFGRERVRSTPIAEAAIIGAAIGAAMAGMLPVAEIMLMAQSVLAFDQIYNHAAKQRYLSGGRTSVPLTVRMASGAGGQFGAHHSDQLESWLAHSPGLKVVMPSSPADAYGLLTSCIFDDDPCIFIEHTLLNFMKVASDAPINSGAGIPLGTANVLQEGSDVTVIGYSKPLIDIQPVLRTLSDDGISVEVVDLRTIAPYDERTVLESVAKTKRAVIIHEARLPFGVGAEISAKINEELFGELAAPVRRVGAPLCPVPFAANLESVYIPGPGDFERAIRSVIEGI